MTRILESVLKYVKPNVRDAWKSIISRDDVKDILE